ncbi:MAG: hypothetical protein Q8N48_13290 [Thiobacillus sp.]|nr:hypothetical protein [Thiobacillus sp.]MDP2979789.1 hypothetical protein [Thiobacillus sp.]
MRPTGLSSFGMAGRWATNPGAAARASWRGGARVLPQRLERLFRHHHHSLTATPGNVLRFAAQGRFDDLAELSFGVLQPPLACRHAFLLLVRLSGLTLAGEAVSVKSRAKDRTE